MKDITLFKTEDSLYLKKISKKSELKKEDTCSGYLLDADEKTARSLIESIKGKDKTKIIALKGRDDVFNRRAVETLKINYLVDVEKEPKKDSLKQRDSGINHVVAKEAKRKNISFLINFNNFKSLSQKEQVKILARIIQNIKICRRAGASIKLASFAKNKNQIPNENNLKGFLTSLEMSSQQVKSAREF